MQNEKNKPLTGEIFQRILLPGVILEDFKNVKLPDDWEQKAAESRKRQKECLARKNAPFKNYRITI